MWPHIPEKWILIGSAMIVGVVLYESTNRLMREFVANPPTTSPVFLLDGVPVTQQFPLIGRLYTCLFPHETTQWSPAQVNAIKRAVGLDPNAVNGELIRPHLVEIESRLSPAHVDGACEAARQERTP